MFAQFRTMTPAQILTLLFNVLAGLVFIAGAFGFADFHPDPEVIEIGGIVVAILNVVRHYQGQQTGQEASRDLNSPGVFARMTATQWLTLGFNVLAGLIFVASAFGFADFHPDPEVLQIGGILVAILNVIRHYQGQQTIQ